MSAAQAFIAALDAARSADHDADTLAVLMPKRV